jgi:hypothetical protein
MVRNLRHEGIRQGCYPFDNKVFNPPKVDNEIYLFRRKSVCSQKCIDPTGKVTFLKLYTG